MDAWNIAEVVIAGITVLILFYHLIQILVNSRNFVAKIKLKKLNKVRSLRVKNAVNDYVIELYSDSEKVLKNSNTETIDMEIKILESKISK